MAFKSKLEVQMEEQQAEKARILNSKDVPTYGLEDAIRDWTQMYYKQQVSEYDDELEVELQLNMTLTLMRNYQKLKEQGKLKLGFVEEVKEGIGYYFAQDYREYVEERGFYSLQFLVFVIMFAKMRGKNEASEIVEFYREHYLEFFIMAPDVPPYKHKLSETTIRTAIASLHEDMLKEFFSEFFAPLMQKAFPSSEENIKDTYAFDGQAMNSTFRKGEEDRRCKGGIVTSLYCCNRKQDVGYEISDKKNQERMDVLKLFARTLIKDTVVMCDALNTQQAVTDAILKANADYLMPIGKNGNKELLDHISAIFWRERKHVQTYVSPQAQKAHGRIESVQIDILPATEYIDPRIKNQHQNLNTIVKYVVNRSYLIDGKTIKDTADERYYISSLKYDDENTIKQVASSITSYWQIETHHAVLDNPNLFNQDGLHACKIETISNIAGFNKIAHTFLSWFREHYTKLKGSNTPLTFKATMNKINKKDLISNMLALQKLWIQHNSDIQ